MRQHEGAALKTEEVDLSTLRIDRSHEHLPKRRRAPAWLWVVLLALAGLVIWLARSWETAGIGVQVATVAALSAASASPVLNASGYVVAQRQGGAPPQPPPPPPPPLPP